MPWSLPPETRAFYLGLPFPFARTLPSRALRESLAFCFLPGIRSALCHCTLPCRVCGAGKSKSRRRVPGATPGPRSSRTLISGSSPLRGGEAFRPRSLRPIRPHIRADHSAPGANRPRAQVPHSHIIPPAIGVDRRAVVAVEPLRAIDQKEPHSLRSHVAQGNPRPSIGLAYLRWRGVVGIAVAHPSNQCPGFAAVNDNSIETSGHVLIFLL
jgi:hypothetical protein